MDKSYFLEIADYNIWANTIVHSWLTGITEAQWSQPIVSSFGSIGATALHIAAAERIWLDRLNRVEKPIWLVNSMAPERNPTLEIWTHSTMGLKACIENLDSDKFTDTLRFKRINGEEVSMLIYHTLAHVFNHSTYHRGQILTLCRQAGYDKVGSTDMLGFFRK